jgi:hypothetical protein
MGHSSIQVTVDIYHHYIRGSNRDAVDRLDAPLDDQKSAAESATSRNQAEVEQAELYPLESEVVENNGAGDWNRTNDLRFTKPPYNYLHPKMTVRAAMNAPLPPV